MDKKKLLFIMNNLHCGGAEKALISLLKKIDYSKYCVDLFLFKHEGVFLQNIPIEVNLIQEQAIVSNLYLDIKTVLIRGLKQLNFNVIYIRLIMFFLSKKYKNSVRVEQYVWKYFSKMITNLKKNYDVAIGFQEKNPIYFCIDKVNAKFKIGWIHTDLEKLELDFDNDYNYFKKLNKIVTVSDGLSERLKVKLSIFNSKIVTIENVISPNVISELSNQPLDLVFDSNYFNIIYVGRIAKEKGLFIGLEAIKILIEKGYKVRWYLIGEGDQKEFLQLESIKYRIDSNIIFLGFKSNPYSYISRASVFLLPSFFEGKSISLEEAKILNMPIVITNFSSSKDQIENGVTGLIADMNSNSIANMLEQLIVNPSLKQKLINNLKSMKLGTENEVTKFYNLIENE